MTDLKMSPAELRAARFEGIVTELRPILARAFPGHTEEALLERAVHIAAYRLSGGDITGHFIG